MDEQLEMRRATPDDGPGIRRLLATVLPGNTKTDPDVMQWQYWHNPFGQAVSWVWTDAGEVVVHTARIPVDALMDGKPVRCAIAVDAATSPHYRRRGLYERLRVALDEDSCRERIVASLMLLGPPSMVPRINVETGLPLVMFVLPLDARWIAERIRIPRLAARASLRTFRTPTLRGGRQIQVCPDGLDELWSDVAEEFPFSIIKGDAWWRWRFEQHPHAPYRFFEVRDGRLAGAAVTVDRTAEHGRVVYILELLASGPDPARALVRSIIDSADGASAIALLAPDASPTARAARAAGMRKVPRRLASSGHSFLTWDACTNAPGDASSWSFTWGDADYL